MSSVRVAPTPSSVGYVRAVLRDDLAVLPEMVREEVALVASELLGNAVRHARALDDGQLVIDWGVGEQGVEIAVTDGGGETTPSMSEPLPTEVGGRGLAIVARLAARWGVEQHGSLTTVWAIVPLRPDKQRRRLDVRDEPAPRSRRDATVRVHAEGSPALTAPAS